MGRFEHVVLLAVLRLDDDAHAPAIAREIAARTGTIVARGALYTSLARLESKGALASRMGEPTAVRGGKARRFYRLTPAGIAALKRARAELFAAWPRVPKLLGDR